MDQKELEIELGALAAHLHQRRSAILAAWGRAAQSDPKLTTSITLSLVQFYDHMPGMLDAVEQQLRSSSLRDKLSATRDETTNAEGHGLQRWQQGYNEREVMREWVWLNECLADELEVYTAGRPRLSSEAVSSAWRLISHFLVTAMSESVGQYARLQRADASARLRALEDAHRELAALEQQRAEAWHEATHDLRGNLSIVHNVASVLQRKGSQAPPKEVALRMLERSVASLHALLNDLTTQARLDAGREQREVRPFDAGQALEELCASSQSLAAERGLFLRAEGPAPLLVEGDRVKMVRIAQNLLLNALKYTDHGGIKVTWEDSSAGAERWMLSVQDTGPGLGTSTNAPLSIALDAATRDSQMIENRATESQRGEDDSAKAPTLASRSPQWVESPGEGIGLAIVKRLCELLDASLELQTEPGKGTTFRVTFPSKYPKG
jgi:signal transduction histidine kinase